MKSVSSALEELFKGKPWHDLEWRLKNLYWIVDDSGKQIPFEPNEEQLDFVRNMHTRNLILKARQLGFSTLIQILELDQSLMNSDFTSVVISNTLPNAGILFAKAEFAYGKLPQALRDALPLKSNSAKTSMEFAHGSRYYVATAPRGDTTQLLHVSELGPIGRRHPERADEIVVGGFESVSQDGIIIVESTAEGSSGHFFELCDQALKRQQEGAPESPLDWRIHFYPWFKKPSYRLDPDLVIVSDKDHRYFDKIQAETGFTIDAAQRAWYVKKAETIGRQMKKQYPSTPQEAFEQAIDGAVFGDEMTAIREKGRITKVPLDPKYPVNTFWDFGLGARNPIWLHQRIGLENRWVKYFDDFGKGLGWWWRTLEDWRAKNGDFLWGTHYLPHDAETERMGEGVQTYKKILETSGMRNIKVVPRINFKETAIQLMQEKLPVDNWFDRENCAEGIKCVDAYQYEWDEKLGRYSNHPLGNWASHGTDAWMQYAQTEFVGSTTVGSIRNFTRRERSWR